MRSAAAAALAFWLVPAAWAGGACPPGLLEAAQAQGETLEARERAVRGSTLALPEGVEETVQFDLAAHACHRGPGQAYREYGEPVCLAAGEGERVRVRYPYRVFYRRALTLDGLFRAAWEEGTPGALQVEFEPEPGGRPEVPRWVPVSRREVLPQLEGRKERREGAQE